MTIKLVERQTLGETHDFLFYLVPDTLERKYSNGLAVDMWSLGIVLNVLLTRYFPYLETTLSGMHKLITTIICHIPHLLSKTHQIIIEQL